MTWLLISVIVASTVASDVLQSYEMKRSRAEGDVLKSAGALRRPMLLISIALLTLSFFAFVEVLSRAPVSFVVPATACTYIFDVLLARLVLGENVDWKRWVGVAVLTAGIVIISI